MPYIKLLQRLQLSFTNGFRDEGEFNYSIHGLLNVWFKFRGYSYSSINAAIGVLECAKMELYRRLAAHYEDYKARENGDVDVYHHFNEWMQRKIDETDRV